MAKYQTNRDLLAELKRRGVSVSAVALQLRMRRATVSERLNNDDRPSGDWLAMVLDACDAVSGGVPTG